MIATISKTFDFDAAHFLPNVPEGHKCGRMHGHTYNVTIEVKGKIGQHTGMAADLDYEELDRAWTGIHDTIDHQVLNDIIDNPTTEVLAVWIYDQLVNETKCCPVQFTQVSAVIVKESSATSCRYEP
jgi:6-pyruvoyltetrahydropterin/6-carboxytetrahydropterin synthase